MNNRHKNVLHRMAIQLRCIATGVPGRSNDRSCGIPAVRLL